MYLRSDLPSDHQTHVRMGDVRLVAGIRIPSWIPVCQVGTDKSHKLCSLSERNGMPTDMADILLVFVILVCCCPTA